MVGRDKKLTPSGAVTREGNLPGQYDAGFNRGDSQAEEERARVCHFSAVIYRKEKGSEFEIS